MLLSSHWQTLARRTITASRHRKPFQQKHASSSASSGGKNPSQLPPTAANPPGSTIAADAAIPLAARQEKAKARAKQLHNEIETIFEKQDKNHADEAKKAKSWKGFMEFLGSNKTNVSIIIVSFLTVVLSVKMVQAKQVTRKLEEDLQKTEKMLVEKRALLKTITSEAFFSGMSKKCDSALNTTALSKKSRTWIGNVSKTRSSHTAASTESLLATVISNEMKASVGDAALSEDEISAREIEALQNSAVDGVGDRESVTIGKLSALSERDALDEALDQQALEWTVDANGKKVAKKSVFVL